MKNFSTNVILPPLFLVMFTVISCDGLDVVASGSVKSFDNLLKAAPQTVIQGEMSGNWTIASPDGAAWFSMDEMMLVLDIKPFIDAGLNPSKLPEEVTYNDHRIYAGAVSGNNKFSGKDSALATYEEIVKRYRSSIGYHAALDHYGVSIGNGNLFEWAKDMDTNDKDMVFVLNPEPFIEAGVDPNKVEGWVFGKVTVDDANGKPIEVDKLLKPFDIR
ncbi:hypothetical protein FACS1894147_04980 [Spirochaetia bacterium]|nr:hypothetical protein FACS1894147_04980 [Spirochaetia bacterium]